MTHVKAALMVLFATCTVACSGEPLVAPDATPSGSASATAAPTVRPVTIVTEGSGPLILSVPSESPGPPLYAAIAEFFMNTDGQWVAIELIRERACIPASFNLLQFVDPPRAFACPLTVEGREWWYREDLEQGPWATIPPFPFEARLVGGPAMLIDFVRLSELSTAIADGVLTIGELESLPSLMIGHVASYLQVQHNSNQGSRPGQSDTISDGTLENGRRFSYHKTDRGNEALAVQIRFE